MRVYKTVANLAFSACRPHVNDLKQVFSSTLIKFIKRYSRGHCHGSFASAATERLVNFAFFKRYCLSK